MKPGKTTIQYHPLLMRPELVKASLEGRKTQTRRVIRDWPYEHEDPEDWDWTFADGFNGACWYCFHKHYPEEGSMDYRCPYGQPGDRLWVRERFKRWFDGEGRWHVRYSDGSEQSPHGVDVDPDADDSWMTEPKIWTPSIFMPRWACRLTLEITEVRVERIQDIIEEDAKAEGIPPEYPTGGDTEFPYRTGFINCWNAINGLRPGCSWESNPWCWCLTFKVVK